MQQSTLRLHLPLRRHLQGPCTALQTFVWQFVERTRMKASTVEPAFSAAGRFQSEEREAFATSPGA